MLNPEVPLHLLGSRVGREQCGSGLFSLLLLCCSRSLSNPRKAGIWQTALVHSGTWSVRQRPKTVWGRCLKWPLELLCKPGVARKSPGAFSYKAWPEEDGQSSTLHLSNFEVLFINLSVWLLAFFIIYNLLKRFKNRVILLPVFRSQPWFL